MTRTGQVTTAAGHGLAQQLAMLRTDNDARHKMMQDRTEHRARQVTGQCIEQHSRGPYRLGHRTASKQGGAQSKKRHRTG